MLRYIVGMQDRVLCFAFFKQPLTSPTICMLLSVLPMDCLEPLLARGVKRREEVLIHHIVRRRLKWLQVMESAKERTKSDVKFAVCKAEAPLRSVVLLKRKDSPAAEVLLQRE